MNVDLSDEEIYIIAGLTTPEVTAQLEIDEGEMTQLLKKKMDEIHVKFGELMREIWKQKNPKVYRSMFPDSRVGGDI